VHVLVAATAGLSKEFERALSWAQASGASTIARAASQDASIALASSGGPMGNIQRSGTTTTMTLGLSRSADFGHLSAGQVPGDTAAVSISPSNALVATGQGNQRLFFVQDRRGTIVSTHVGALVAALGSGAVVERSYEDFLLGFGFLPDGRTPFRGIYALPRPSVVELRTGEPVDLAPKARGSLDIDVDVDVADLLCEIVDEQAGDSRTVAVLLGGFDSALVAAALHRTGREVHTFTFQFSEPGFEQRNVAAAVAAAGAHHHWVHFTPEILGQALLELPTRLNQPSPQPHYQLQTIIAAEAARDAGAEIIFTGDGCDALFAAYPTINTRAAANQMLQKVPASIRRSALALLSTKAPENLLGHVARVGRSSLRASLIGAPASQHLPTQYLDQVALNRLRNGVPPEQTESITEIRLRLAAESAVTGAARLAIEGNSLTGQSQSKVEGIVARTGLQVFSPFTDPRFRAAISLLPEHRQVPSGKLRGAEGKPVLQEAASRAGLLPDAVIYQKKQSPTEAPVDIWYAGPLRATVFTLLEGLPFEFDRHYVDQILQRKRMEDLYRSKLAISRHAFQAIGLLASYAAFTRLSS